MPIDAAVSNATAQVQSEYSFGSPVASVHTRDDDDDADDDGLAAADDDAELRRLLRRSGSMIRHYVLQLVLPRVTDHCSFKLSACGQATN